MTSKKKASKQRLQAHQLGKVAASYLRSGQGGFTIVESLIAIIVAGVLLAAIAPVITLAVATRVQSRRVELATQAAKAYIDGVRTQKIPAPAPPDSNATLLTDFSAPTPSQSFSCTANSYCTTTSTSTTPTNLYCIDFDGLPTSSPACENTSLRDMVVQAFRYNPANNTPTSGYTLGVRVYRASAFSGSTTLLKNTSTTKTTQATFTGGLGPTTAPLVEMTTDISDTVPSYNDLCARLSGCSN